MRPLARAFVSVFVVSIATCEVCLADDNADDILGKLQKKYDSIRDASVAFTQDVLFGVTQAEQTFSGKLFMKKGNKYRIELEQQTIVTDGKSVWSYTKVSNQVLIDKYKENPGSFSPDKIMVNVPENYFATLLGKGNIGKREATILKLVPKDEKSNLKWMKVWIDRDDWLMKKIQVLDVSDNITTYSIADMRLNTGIADSAFQFEVPQGAEVIDIR